MSSSNNSGCSGCLWVVTAVAIFGVVVAYRANQKAKDEEHAILRAADWTTQYLRDLNTNQGPVETDLHESFWPDGDANYSPDGYLISDKFIPLRAIARKPNASLFASEQLEYPAGVVGVMTPWQPYYVFKRTKVVSQGSNSAEMRVMLIGVHAQTAEADRYWVNEDDCFCWTTRECINVEIPIKVYPTRKAAEQDTTPRDEAYTFTHATNFMSGQTGRAEQAFRMASLPVLRREDGGYWCFVRPEGTDAGYQVCWIKWDGEDPAVVCRIRTSRHEFEEYLSGVRTLMTDYRTPEKSAAAKQDLYATALENMTHASSLVTDTLDDIKTSQQGIPKLTGFLEMPIESPLQYESVSKRLIGLLQLSELDVWDINEIAYIPASDLP
jgi:hypothetical protein